MLPDKAVIEFQAIYQKEIGDLISFDEAKKEAENFIQLFDLVIKKDEYEKNDGFHHNSK